MRLEERIHSDMKTALLGGNRFEGEVLRNLKAAFLNEEVATGTRETGLSDEIAEKVIAPLPSPTRVHVKSVKVAVPPEDAFVVVPPIVQAPVPALAVATTLLVDDTPVVQ